MTEREDYHAKILRVLIRMERDIDRAWTLEELASIASFSPYHFHRVFTSMVGEPVATYLRRIRLEAAAGQLSGTTLPVSEIGASYGYENPEVFSRAFAKRFGISPSRFREIASDIESLDRSESGELAWRVAARWRAMLPADDGSEVDAEIVRMPTIRCAFVRAFGPYAKSGPGAWRGLGKWAKKHGIPLDTRQRFSVSHDDPAVADERRLRLDACVEILDDESDLASGPVCITDVRAGEYARLVHPGHISTIGRTFSRAYGRWLPASGRELRAAPALLQHIGPRTLTGPSKRTAVLLPLRSRTSRVCVSDDIDTPHKGAD